MATVAIPQYSAYKNRSYKSDSKDNLHNLHLACSAFWSDNSDSDICTIALSPHASYGFISSGKENISVIKVTGTSFEATGLDGFIFSMSKALKHLFNCELVTLFAIDCENREIYSKNFTPTKEVSEIRVPVSTESLLGYVAASGKILNVRDVYDKDELNNKCPNFHHDSSWDKILNFKTKSVLVIPIADNKKMVGILQCVNSMFSEGFSQTIPKEWLNISLSLGSTLTKIEKEKTHELLESMRGKIQQTKSINNILLGLEQNLLELFRIEMVTIYTVDTIGNTIYSKSKSGDKVAVIRVPISEESIAGYVALSKQPINIENVNNPDELKNLNPKLKFNNEYDLKTSRTTKSMLVHPLVSGGELLGVVQLINKKNGDTFTSTDEYNLDLISHDMSLGLHRQLHPVEKRYSKYHSLVTSGYISESELSDCYSKAREERCDVEAVLLSNSSLSREHLGRSLENYYCLPYQRFQESLLKIDPTKIGLSLKHLSHNQWIPIQSDKNKVVVVVHNPGDSQNMESVKMIFGNKKIEFKVGLKIDINDYILLVSSKDEGVPYFVDQTGSGDISRIIAQMHQETVSLDDKTKKEKENKNIVLKLISDQFPYLSNKISGPNWSEYELDSDSSDVFGSSEDDGYLVRLVNTILKDACDQGVSDIHIEPGFEKDPVQIRFRRDGLCHIYHNIPYQYKRPLISRIKIMAKLDIAERRFPQDGKIRVKYDDTIIEYRVVTIPTSGDNEDVVIRILSSGKPIPLEKMKFSERNLILIKDQIEKPYGLILVVGPTGSGKTTTLHSCLSRINKAETKIWTAEDPIEILQKGLRQVQITNRINFGFSDAMKTFLRGDPDVIMIGEMRDQNTCSTCLEASLTGHLVFSTLHTNSAPETITRLMDMGMNHFSFADALLLIISQRLVRTLCVNCKEDYHPDLEEFNFLSKEYGEDSFKNLNIEYSEKLILKRRVGCKDCNNSGYSGRIAIHELLSGTDSIKRLIINKSTIAKIRSRAILDGMTTLKQDGISKVFKGECDLSQVLSVCTV